ncbi:MAG: lysozyme inhibitor LprI family protein [Paracoccaceae bacterium]|nr:lysozyme inhibitor LprI family protein [Paracoccaceae bacterium]MDG1738166.1 lysozyme inhibitor LprI family protein [Paracoccaceae bacterium]MDG2258976.1 lysozyme inhibitor LprI family protein [Paracoccaceae bacterium]
MRWLFVTISLLWALPVQAASFDCAKASTEIEHAICNNPELSRLDEEMAAAYRSIPKSNKYFENLQQDQKDWLRIDRSDDVQSFERRAKYLAAYASLSVCLNSSDNPEICHGVEENALDACMSAGQYTTFAMDTCSAAMAEVWNSLLAVEVEEKRERLRDDPETLQLFDEAALMFETYRDAECGWRYSEYRDGTIRGQIWFGCYLDLTSRRTISAIQDNQLF